jgi:hypothetical protein
VAEVGALALAGSPYLNALEELKLSTDGSGEEAIAALGERFGLKD